MAEHKHDHAHEHHGHTHSHEHNHAAYVSNLPIFHKTEIGKGTFTASASAPETAAT